MRLSVSRTDPLSVGGQSGVTMGLPSTAAFLLAVIAVAMSAEGINEEVVFEERSFGLALTTHARTRRSIGEVATAPPRERNPIVYFYSRGGRQIRNRGAEVFHQLHDAVGPFPTPAREITDWWLRTSDPHKRICFAGAARRHPELS